MVRLPVLPSPRVRYPPEFHRTRVPYRYTVASALHQLDQIHELNHQTFAVEIPQHAPSDDGVRVDRFDEENTYLVALDGETVVGMMAMRGERPFSLDAKLNDLDAHLPPERPIVEIRLLAVRPERRHGRAFVGLMAFAVRWMVRQGFQMAIISGTTRQLALYRRLGFTPFGPLVGHEGAQFQPMATTLADTVRQMPDQLPPSSDIGINLLPGPVELAPAVREAMAQPLQSHRGETFLEMHARVMERLKTLVQAPNVAPLMGTGTLANEAVAAHLAAWDSPGLILSNGEFGDRLIDHATRHQLDHHVLRVPWGETFDPDAIASTLSALRPAWIWAVHGETSTGVLNDLPALLELATAHGARLCLDAVSTIGAVPVDLSSVMMASGVSGKALGSAAGLAFVAYDTLPPLSRPVPRALDLAYNQSKGGVPFTSSSLLVAALDAALAEATPARMARLQRQGCHVRTRLRQLGFSLVAPDDASLPTVQTIELANAEAVGARLEALGIFTSYRSGYLRARGWLQLCTMGALTDRQLELAVAALDMAVEVEHTGDSQARRA
ncbi:MAG: aminotransferase class V-fold PLP-dependent enzyme [Rubricoccaceae bacterium]